MTTETILTDEQKAEFVTDIIGYGTGFVAPLFATVESIEQAVLQSEQVQAWKRDAERYHEIRSRLTGSSYDPRYFEDLFIAGCMGHPDAVDGEIDAAMEQKT